MFTENDYHRQFRNFLKREKFPKILRLHLRQRRRLGEIFF